MRIVVLKLLFPNILSDDKLTAGTFRCLCSVKWSCVQTWYR